MEKYDVIVVGELNVDIILNQIDGFPVIGKEILSGSLDLTLGSSSAIFASNLSSLGTKVAFVGKIGKDGFASTVLDNLKEKGVTTSQILVTEKINTGATIVLNYNQDRANVTYPGAMADLKMSDINWDVVKKARHLHLSSVFLQPGIRSQLPELFRKAKQLGLTTSLDPQWDPEEKWEIDLQELLPEVDIFLPNINEFLLLTGADSLEKGIEMVKSYSPKLNLVVKKGADGAIGWKGDKIFHQPAFLNKNAVDCIGAGDSFNAGFIHLFLQGKTFDECLAFGALTGAVSTTKAGGTGAFSDIIAATETIQNNLLAENQNLEILIKIKKEINTKYQHA